MGEVEKNTLLTFDTSKHGVCHSKIRTFSMEMEIEKQNNKKIL